MHIRSMFGIYYNYIAALMYLYAYVSWVYTYMNALAVARDWIIMQSTAYM